MFQAQSFAARPRLKESHYLTAVNRNITPRHFGITFIINKQFLELNFLRHVTFTYCCRITPQNEKTHESATSGFGFDNIGL